MTTCSRRCSCQGRTAARACVRWQVCQTCRQAQVACGVWVGGWGPACACKLCCCTPLPPTHRPSAFHARPSHFHACCPPRTRLRGPCPVQRLRLRCCQLPAVPAELGELVHLTHLDLSRNQLVELPMALSDLEELRELVAEGNCFPRIPMVRGGAVGCDVAWCRMQVSGCGWAGRAPRQGRGGLGAWLATSMWPMLFHPPLPAQGCVLCACRCWVSCRHWGCGPAMHSAPNTNTHSNMEIVALSSCHVCVRAGAG